MPLVQPLIMSSIPIYNLRFAGRCFRQRVSYYVHRRIHTGVLPYKCTECDRSFRYKVSQRTHKCSAQPPGEVVRQTGDLLQRLIQSSMLNIGVDAENGDCGDVANRVVAAHDLTMSEDVNSAGTESNVIPENHKSMSMVDDAVVGFDKMEQQEPHYQQHQQPLQQQLHQHQPEQHHHIHFSNNQALDAFIAEHCNMIGLPETLPDDPIEEAAPSPSSQFQNMCLYSSASPTPSMVAAVGGGADCGNVAEAMTSPTGLDALDELALSNFMNAID